MIRQVCLRSVSASSVYVPDRFDIPKGYKGQDDDLAMNVLETDPLSKCTPTLRTPQVAEHLDVVVLRVPDPNDRPLAGQH